MGGGDKEAMEENVWNYYLFLLEKTKIKMIYEFFFYVQVGKKINYSLRRRGKCVKLLSLLDK